MATALPLSAPLGPEGGPRELVGVRTGTCRGPPPCTHRGHTSSGSHFLREAARVLGFLLFPPVFLRAAAQWVVDGVSARLALPSDIPVGVCPPSTLPAFPLWYVPQTCTPSDLELGSRSHAHVAAGDPSPVVPELFSSPFPVCLQSVLHGPAEGAF